MALSVFAAAGISGAGVWETEWEAIKLAAAGFIMPFIFAYDNSFLLMGVPGTMLLVIITAVSGCIVLSTAVSGWMFFRLNLVFRLLLLVAGVCLIVSKPLMVNGIGLALAISVILALRIKQRNT